MGADVAQAVKCLGQGFRDHVITAHGMADLHGAAGQLVDLRGLTGQAAPVRYFEVAKGNQAFQVLEGN